MRRTAGHPTPVKPRARLARCALALYPPSFRRRYGGELAETWRRMDAQTRRRGVLARVAWRAAAVADVVRTAGAEWVETLGATIRRFHPPQQDQRFTHDRTLMTGLLFDFKGAVRAVAQRPALAASVIVTLALGIGANTAIFSLIDAVLLHPLPVARPEELVAVFQAANARTPRGASSYPAYRALAGDNRAVTGLAAYDAVNVSVQSREQRVEVSVGVVSGNYFGLLGVRPQRGRLLTPNDEHTAGAGAVVVLGDALWERLYARDPAAVGASLRIGPTVFRVVGVAPRGFRGVDFASSPELWVPVTMAAHVGAGGLFGTRMGAHVLEAAAFPWLRLVGRLRPGVSATRAAAELNRLYDTRVRPMTTVPARFGSQRRAPMSVAPVVEAAVVGDRGSLLRFVRLLVAVVGLTLALACVNVANLLLVRWTERAREVGVRLALGASRTRIVRQLLLESLVLAVLGGAAALVVAAGTIRLLSVFTLPGDVQLGPLDLALGWRVLAFTAATAALTAFAFGIIPAIRSSRADLMRVLRRQTGQTARGTSRATLLGVQVAMSVVLLTGAALFLRSVREGLRADLGFDPTPLAAAAVQPTIHGYTGQRAVAFYQEVLTRLTKLPGVERAAIATHVPLAPATELSWSVEPAPAPDGDAAPGAPGAAAGTPASGPGTPRRPGILAGINAVTPGYFATIGVPIVAGRDIAPGDADGHPKVAVVNEAAARRFWPGEDPIGKEVRVLDVIAYRVVGVVRTTKYATVRERDVPFVFTSFAQDPGAGTATFVARSSRPAVALAEISRAIRATDASLPIHDARLVRRQIDTVLMPQRFGATLLTLFALVGLVVSAAGIYGTVRFAATRRLPEIGVRIALGAQPADIVRLVSRSTGLAVFTGLVVGLAASASGARLLASFLYGIRPLDPLAFAGAAMVLSVTALTVALVPARKASRTDPAASMRS